MIGCFWVDRYAYPSSSFALMLRSFAKLRARRISDTCPISVPLPLPVRLGSPAEMRTVTSGTLLVITGAVVGRLSVCCCTLLAQVWISNLDESHVMLH